MRSLRRRLRRHCNRSTYHVWNEDPQAAIRQGDVFHRVDCVYCDYCTDAITLTNAFDRVSMPVPGRVADLDELAAWRERKAATHA
jgi:hypothetical protein